MTVKILCVADGGITAQMWEDMRVLEPLGAEVTIVEDTAMGDIADITNRMGLLEQQGIDAAPSCPELLAACAEADVIAVHVAAVNKEVIAASPNLKVVAVLRGGVENADAEALRERGIALINAPMRSADAVADFTVGMMIAENKNIARSHLLLHEGEWCKKYVNQAYIRNMRKCTVGLIGFGYIGERVAKRLSGFESKVIAYDPYKSAADIAAWGAEKVETIDEVLAQSDFVSLHLRTSPETTNLIDAAALAKMKPTAYLINTARAALVDEAALVDALRTRRIGGAAIDVYDTEPMPADHPYLTLDNITLTPHIAGTSADTMQASVEIGIDDLTRYVQGEPMVNVRS